MSLFVFDESTAERNIDSLLEGYMIDGVEVLDDDDEGPNIKRSNHSSYSRSSSSNDFDKYEQYQKEDYKRIDDDTAEELKDIEQRLETAKQDFRTKFSNRPKSWLESKLIGFKKMLIKFRARHKATKGNKSKTIIQKIIYVITNIINFINDKLIKITRAVNRNKRYDYEKRSARRELSGKKRFAEFERQSAMNLNSRRKGYSDLESRHKVVDDYIKDTLGRL